MKDNKPSLSELATALHKAWSGETSSWGEEWPRIWLLKKRTLWRLSQLI
ncbi:MAG TPA: hypothetical protein VJ836_02225 [Candidatus Saccharimonadales bacterium]|nr:hypothetical protein [Candidatus Saccharimonadales bacterium]